MIGSETNSFTDWDSGGAFEALKPSAASDNCGCAIIVPRLGVLAGTAGTAGSRLGAEVAGEADAPTGEAETAGVTAAVRTFVEGGTAALPTGAVAGGAGWAPSGKAE